MWIFCSISTKTYRVISCSVVCPYVLWRIHIKQNCSRYYFFYLFIIFSEKTRLGISCELSARKTICMKCQALFSLKNTKQNQNVFCYSLDLQHFCDYQGFKGVEFVISSVWRRIFQYFTVKSLLDAQALINAHPPIWMLKMSIFLDNSRKITAFIKCPLEKKKDLTLCWKFPNLLLDRRTQKSFSLVVQIKS